MINGLEGIPGSGKSYEAVAYHVLVYLAQSRLVVTNLPLLVDMIAAINPEYRQFIELRVRPLPVRGTWDADRVIVDEKGNTSGEAFELFEDGHTEPAPPRTKPFGHVWDYYHTWKDGKGRGPVYIIDECHTSLPKIGTDEHVVQWFKLHRHFNADVLLMTQMFRGMCQDIAGLIAMMVKCRKADILGDSDSYIRKVHAGYRGAVISSEVRKYKPEIFGLYKSHTQGNSVAESMAQDVQPLYVKLRRFTRWFWVVTICACIGAVLFAFRDKKPKGGSQAGTVSTVTTSIGPPPGVQTPRGTASSANLPANPVKPVREEKPDLEPLKDKFVHITGWLRGPRGIVYTFTVSGQGVRLFDLVGADLVGAGYKWKPLGECLGYLTWEQRTRAVTCDAPVIQTGSSNAPVVMDFKSGARSDELSKSAPAVKS
jgi:zona occludens toxin